MKILIISLCIVIISATAYADIFFPDDKIKDLRVIKADHENGIAWILDKNGNQAEVYIGDQIGIDEGVVIGIDDNHITIQKGNTATKVRVIVSRQKARMDALAIDAPMINP